ncbi:MAG: MFS transporter [Rhodospirillales bacterium]|nr:MFS transporter [Rhodospirillales bacterium]
MFKSNLYGWLIVALCFVALSLAMSARSTLGLVMPVWEAELGWSRSFVSTGASLTLIVIAIVAPVAGNSIDRFGPRIVLTLGMLAVGAGLILTATMQQAWQFLVFFGVAAAIGFGIVANHIVSTTVALHFDANRGLATGAATAGSTAGQLLVVPALAVLLVTTGWRPSFLALGIGALALAPVMWLFIRRHQSPRPNAGEANDALATRLAYLLRSRVFHALLWSFVICGFTTAGVIEVHLIPYAIACGFPPLQSAYAYGALSAFNMIGMIGAGYLTDRMSRPLLLGSIYIARGLCFIILMYIAGDLPLLFIFAVAFGLFDYSTVPPTASLVASHLGLRIMGLAMGLLAAGHALGAALGAFLGGYLFDLFARYDFVWIASIGLAITAGLIAFTIRENRAPTTLQPQAA